MSCTATIAEVFLFTKAVAGWLDATSQILGSLRRFCPEELGSFRIFQDALMRLRQGQPKTTSKNRDHDCGNEPRANALPLLGLTVPE